MTETQCENNDFLVEYSPQNFQSTAGGLNTAGGLDTAADPAIGQLLPALLQTAYKGMGKIFSTMIAAQLLILCSFAAAPAFTLATGREVVLKTLPVDPYDIFRGEYVTLRYEISHVRGASGQLRPGQPVFVILRQGAPCWQADRVETQMPSALPANEVAIKAKVQYAYNGEADVHYGIEQYYVPEGVGKVLQRAHQDVKVAVDCFGNAVIKSIDAKDNSRS